MNLKYLFSLIVLFGALGLNAQQSEVALIGDPDSKIKLRASAELGYVAALSHKIQFSNAGTYYDYVKDGGQDVLFPFTRLSLDMEIGRNTITLLYQPLRLESEVLLSEDLIVDDLTFPAGIGIRNLYNFPFYRISYMREVLPNRPRAYFSWGGTVQIRNATISFESLDGSLFRTDRNVGIVPAFKLRTGTLIGSNFFAEIEADGIYAPVSYLNGSDNEVVGAILDGSFRIGANLRSDRLFLNLRYLGGGAVGTSTDDEGPGDGYVRNWLHFLTVGIGYSYQF
ncbi:MAG: hypothetical protein AAFN10_27170 [Bacteroidota bacterium]